MTRSLHIGMSVRGVLHSGEWRRSLVGACTDQETGRLLTADEIFDALCDELAQGHEVIPYGEACDRWDWKTGCMGHDGEADGALIHNHELREIEE